MTAPGADQAPSDRADPSDGDAPPGAVAPLSWPARAAVTGVAIVIALGAGWHMLSSFFYVAAPDNLVTDQFGAAITGYQTPEFRRGYKVFAPNPPTSNVTVEARAELRDAAGATRTTGWIDVTAPEVAHIRHNPLPSHTARYQRQSWLQYDANTDEHFQPLSAYGAQLDTLVHRTALRTLAGRLDVRQVTRVQLRGVATRIPAPPWQRRSTSAEPVVTESPWRDVTPAHLPGGRP